ncbi:MAG TPA: glycosyltransferase family 39 protein [Alphaproteobacteria bacterium]|nr:glycosyltransferase family 39 protein [Alphaproteobacteria bacterium]
MNLELNRSGLWLVALAALLPRLLLALYAPSPAGDWKAYSTVADNVLLNHCVSLSDPASAACVPHWGGNQLPGYPWFMALVWSFLPRGLSAIVISQSLLITVSTVYLARHAAALFPNRRWALAAALLMALSPLLVPLARVSLPDALAVAAAQWVLAELVRSHLQARLRVVPLALASIVAVFLRYDSFLLALPIALTGIALHGPGEAFKRGLVLALIVALPLGMWWGRSITAGLGMYPMPYTLPSGGAPPMGYISWGKTWAVDQYQAPLWVYAVYTRLYETIDIDPKIHHNDAERRRVEALVAELRDYQNKPFPPHIDAAFAEIAAQRRAAGPWRYWLVLPLKRAAALWFSLRNSAAWPVSLRLARSEKAAGLSRFVEIALANPGPALVKLGTAAYRLVLPLAALALWVLAWHNRWRLEAWLLASALALALGRTLFMATLLMTEPRYVVEAIPFLELAVAVALARLGRERPEQVVREVS